MQSPDLFIGLFTAIAIAFGAIAWRARHQMREEREARRAAARRRRRRGEDVDDMAGATLAEIDRKIADLLALRDRRAEG